MTVRKEFVALIEENKEQFKNSLFSLIEDQITEKMAELYIKESEQILLKLSPSICEESINQPEEIQEEILLPSFPVTEISEAISSDRTHWMVTKDGSQIEITPKTAKYIMELYNSLNTLHKEKLVNLITESQHGFKKALKTAEKLYGDKNGH